MYRDNPTSEEERVIALDAKTGKTLWEHANPSPYTETMTQFGPGPHSTPLISGDRLYTIGTNGVMHCLDRNNGAVLWKHDLPEEYGAPVLDFGYSCSPVAYKNMIIVSVDRERSEAHGGSSQQGQQAKKVERETEGQSLMAFDQGSGRVVWKSVDFPIDYASPILIEFEGEPQLVLIMRSDIIGVNPERGTLVWRYPFTPVPVENIATPLWDGGNQLFFSAAYNAGSRVLKLAKNGGETVPEELWYSRKMRVHHGNAIRVGDHVYGSSGDFGAPVFVAVNAQTGKRVWADREIGKSTCVYGDGKLIALDENGYLALATISPEGLTVHSKCQVTEHASWTVPTLVGKTLYVRDRKHIMALDLG